MGALGAPRLPVMVNRSNRRAAPTQSPPPDGAFVERAAGDVRRRLEQAARPAAADRIRKEAGRDVPCHGAPPADVHRIGLDLVRKLRAAGLPSTLAIADNLFRSGNVEEGLVGAQIVGALARLITGGDFERIEPWGDSLTSPQTADALGANCLSPSLAAKPSLVKTMREWTRSDNPSKRRAAAAAFSPLVREGRFGTDALETAELLMEDPSEEVQRGVGAMLMEMSRLNGDRAADFLAEWKGRSPRLLLETAASRLQPAQRERALG